MSDKVRHFLEQSIPEIQDLKKRGIFEEEELRKVMKRRTEYEHRIQARTVKPAEFLSYASYETNVDKLRSLRVKRLRKQGSLKGNGVSDWAGQRRINYIYDRAVKRFPAQLSLWMRMIEFAKANNAVQQVNKALVQMLRMHPTNPNVWVYVAKYQNEENASVQEARAVLQRGLRFNAQSQYLWLEYIRLELIYVAKILARRKLLGLQQARKDEQKEQEKGTSLDFSAEDMAKAQMEDSEIKNLPDVNVDILGDVSSNPALRGDVALAVFDAGVSQFPESQRMEFSQSVLEIIDGFSALDRQHLASHVLQWMQTFSPTDTETEKQLLLLPIRYTEFSSPQFPDQLRLVFKMYAKRSSTQPELRQKIREFFQESFLSGETESLLDINLKKAIEMFISRL